MSNFDAMADKIIGQLSSTKADLIFGESREYEGKMVIPVGKIAYGWGGGSGKNESKEKKESEQKSENEGTGMGMGAQIKPMGFITITADSVTYQPIIDMAPVVYIGSVFAGILAMKMLKMCMMSMCMGKKRMCGKCGMHGKQQHMHGMHGMWMHKMMKMKHKKP